MQHVGQHQREIEELFAGRVLYSDPEPRFALPLIVLAFTNRSGSNLLAEYLRLTGNFAGFFEHLNGQSVRKMVETTRADSFPDHVDALFRNMRSDVSALGVKSSWNQILMLLRWRINRMFQSFHILHIEREDVLAQAVSFSIANQTRQWMSTQNRMGAEPRYNPTDIMNRVDGIGHGNKMIRQICAIYGLDTMRVCYETLISDPIPELCRIHRWLDIPVSRLELSKARLKKQSGPINAEFISRIRAEALEALESESLPVEA